MGSDPVVVVVVAVVNGLVGWELWFMLLSLLQLMFVVVNGRAETGLVLICVSEFVCGVRREGRQSV